jgi:hypothetical protein
MPFRTFAGAITRIEEHRRRRIGPGERPVILLRREGEPSGINRIYRHYARRGTCGAKASRPVPRGGNAAPVLVETKVNTRWSLDSVHDQLAGGRRFRILNVVDDVTRERLAAIRQSGSAVVILASPKPSVIRQRRHCW